MVNLFDNYAADDPEVFERDPLYYHMELRYLNWVTQTDNLCDFVVMRLKTDVGVVPLHVWVPKKICRRHNETDKTVMVHRATYKKILKDAITASKIKHPEARKLKE
ncbi:MAG: hypothetical protein OEX12_08905 [Gammaproteobacteria bacterium]|nr:hypothetical protein [Gammaproteobacteria bacterium]